MPRRASPGRTQALQRPKQPEHLGVAAAMAALMPPRRDHERCLRREMPEPPVIGGTHGRGGGQEIAWSRRAIGKQVADADPAEAPAPGEPNAAADRRVVALRIGSRGVEADEEDDRAPRIPGAPECVPVRPAAGERGGSVHNTVTYGDAWRRLRPAVELRAELT